MKHLIEFNLETLEVIKIDPIFEEVDETIIESTGIPEELIIEPITIIDSDTATVIYEGALPCDREGYTKTLYFGYEDNDNNNAVVLLNKSLTVKQPIVYAVYTEIEGWFEVANQKDVENLKLQNQGVYGLGFKSGDNTVNLKTPEINLGLNDFTVEIWAKGEGCTDGYPLLGSQNRFANDSYLWVTPNSSTHGSNGIRWIEFYGGAYADFKNSIPVNKSDSTKNLHHIIITRSGTLVTAIINGRLIKSVTQDRVLDFSKFVFDIANTTYFSLGRVFNYAMSADEVQMLWNGGRCDEVVLSDNCKKTGIDGNYTSSNKAVWNSGEVFLPSNITSGIFYAGDVLDIEVEVNKPTNGLRIAGTVAISSSKLKHSWSDDKSKYNVTVLINKTFTAYAGSEFSSGITGINQGDEYSLINYKIKKQQCLLELLPQNIHSSGIYNTGSLGSSHDAVLSKPEEITFIKEKPYKDKQMSVGAPNFHPIAMGQKVYSDTGLIYEAAIPPTSREWSTNDWKQVNNN